MKQYNCNISSIDDLSKILRSKELNKKSLCRSLLVQIYSAHNNCEWYKAIGEEIRLVFPSATIIGASSVGEIISAKFQTNSTTLLFSFFESSSIHLFSHTCTPGNEQAIGELLINEVESLNIKIKGMLLLSTPISNDSGTIFNSISRNMPDFPVFGGGAGDYANQRNTLVFDGLNCLKNGILSVVFSGDELQINVFSSLGWIPLSKEMTMTDIGPALVKTIDGSPAFSVYERYLGIKADSNFFQNSLEFPFLIYRNNNIVARTPFFVNEEDGSIQLVADVKAGEKFRIGYGNPQIIKAESARILNRMHEFQPEAIFLYSCICRRFLMQEEVDQETLPFKNIAPTAGFYTFGEFFSDCNFSSLLNSTLVAVGIREDGNRTGAQKIEPATVSNLIPNTDPYLNQHNRILSHLLHFIEELIKEHDQQNKLLKDIVEQKNELLGMAAHDLRNPLSAIQGFSELLEEQVDESFKQYATIISKESMKMLQLLNDLLDISKIEAGRLDLRMDECDYVPLVRQNINMNSFIARNKNINIVSRLKIANQMLRIDQGKIEQVLNNLLSNAIKYSYPGSTITVKVFRDEDNVTTQIIDQGQGIPSKEIDQIFSAFKTSSVHPTGSETSHGLGLAIVKKIIEGHNGEINVHSIWGKGSVFTFTLPVLN